MTIIYYLALIELEISLNYLKQFLKFKKKMRTQSNADIAGLTGSLRFWS